MELERLVMLRAAGTDGGGGGAQTTAADQTPAAQTPAQTTAAQTPAAQTETVETEEQQITLPDWPTLVKTLPEGLREEALRSTGLAGLVERLQLLRKAVSKARQGYVPAPREDMTEAERAELYKALGVPEKPEGYALSMPDEMLGDDAARERLGRFAALMHQAGAPAKVARAAVEFHVAEVRREAEAEAARLAAIVEETKTRLRQEWGADYDRLRGVAKAAAEWAFGSAGVAQLEAAGALAHEAVIKGLAKIGAQLGESLPEVGQSRAVAENELMALQEEARRRYAEGTYIDPSFQRRYIDALRRVHGE